MVRTNTRRDTMHACSLTSQDGAPPSHYFSPTAMRATQITDVQGQVEPYMHAQICADQRAALKFPILTGR